MPILKPKLFTTLKGYTKAQFAADAVAGVIVGIVALPLAIAFAIASGVSPERGLYTAIVGGFIVAVLGGSRVQIGGPTGAFIVVVYGIVQRFGLEGLQMATLMAGGILIIMGVARFGAAIKFIPYPVTVGFTSGIAVIIFSSQIKDFFGLPMGAVPVDFLHRWAAYRDHLGSMNPSTTAVALGSLAIILVLRRVAPRVPGFLVALVAATVAVQWWDLPVETIASRFGEIPHGLPVPSLPTFDLAQMRLLVPSATTIALLAGIEALLSAVVADGMIGGRHRSNMELVAQGVANLGSPLFGGIPATGAIARTATNVQCGGRTPVAGIIHAVTLFGILLGFGKWAGLIPLSCLAAILVLVAYNMSEWHSFLTVLKSPRSDVAVLLTTFGLTVLVDLTAAIQVGMVLAAFLFMGRMAEVANVSMVVNELNDADEPEDPNAIGARQVPKQVEVYEINGPLFFGASYEFKEAMRVIGSSPKARILRMRNVLTIDATGLHVLREQAASARKHGIPFLLADVHAQPLVALERSGVLELVGPENVFGNVDAALARARELLGLPKATRSATAAPTVRREMPGPSGGGAHG